eukprot:TRINITY_DN449_c0_g4_i1.p1 TRINITY_DN449_c0_g4~~TRINITY_DN449_c0_g4_i1.p1  ORF type:complete len:759 (-),score=242.66 TRINITY_DN449_c0_g4_i1:48-2018(-)
MVRAALQPQQAQARAVQSDDAMSAQPQQAQAPFGGGISIADMLHAQEPQESQMQQPQPQSLVSPQAQPQAAQPGSVPDALCAKQMQQPQPSIPPQAQASQLQLGSSDSSAETLRTQQLPQQQVLAPLFSLFPFSPSHHIPPLTGPATLMPYPAVLSQSPSPPTAQQVQAQLHAQVQAQQLQTQAQAQLVRACSPCSVPAALARTQPQSVTLAGTHSLSPPTSVQQHQLARPPAPPAVGLHPPPLPPMPRAATPEKDTDSSSPFTTMVAQGPLTLSQAQFLAQQFQQQQQQQQQLKYSTAGATQGAVVAQPPTGEVADADPSGCGWTGRDDLTLKDAVVLLGDFDRIFATVKFSRSFSTEDITVRWQQLLYNERVARTAAPRMLEAVAAAVAPSSPPVKRPRREHATPRRQADITMLRFLEDVTLQAEEEQTKVKEEPRELQDGAAAGGDRHHEERKKVIEAYRHDELQQRRELIVAERDCARERDRDRDTRALATLRGLNLRYAMRSRECVIGRSTPKNGHELQVDVNLFDEALAAKVSRVHAIVKLKRDCRFHIRNVGRRPIFVNGHAVACGASCPLSNGCLIDICGIGLVFEINMNLLRKLRKTLHQLAAYGTAGVGFAAPAAPTTSSSVATQSQFFPTTPTPPPPTTDALCFT